MIGEAEGILTSEEEENNQDQGVLCAPEAEAASLPSLYFSWEEEPDRLCPEEAEDRGRALSEGEAPAVFVLAVLPTVEILRDTGTREPDVAWNADTSADDVKSTDAHAIVDKLLFLLERLCFVCFEIVMVIVGCVWFGPEIGK